MREIHFENTYIKDFKLVKKQGWNLEKNQKHNFTAPNLRNFRRKT